MVTYLTSISDEWGVFLILPVLFYVVTEFLWVSHTPCCLYVGIFCCIHISHTVFVGSFFFMLHAILCGEFLLRIPCCFCAEFLVHDLCYFTWGRFLTRPMLLCVGSFLYTPVLFIYLFGEFLWHAPCCFMGVWGGGGGGLWGSHACPIMQFYIGNFSYTPHAFLCWEFLLHTLCCFMWGVSVMHPVLFCMGGCGCLNSLVWHCNRLICCQYGAVLFRWHSYILTQSRLSHNTEGLDSSTGSSPDGCLLSPLI